MSELQNFSDDFETQLVALKELASETRDGWRDVLRAVAAIPPLPAEAGMIRLAATIDGDYLLPAETVLVGDKDGRSLALDADRKARVQKARDAIWDAAPQEVLDCAYALRGTVFKQPSQNTALHKVYDEVWFPLLRDCVPPGLFADCPVAVKCGLFDFDGGLLEITLSD